MLVRAVQGHSISDIDYSRVYTRVSVDILRHLEVLWHGAKYSSITSIMKEGLKPMGRRMTHCVAFPFGDPRSRHDALDKYDAAIEICLHETILTNKMWLTPNLTVTIEGELDWRLISKVYGFEGTLDSK